MTTQPHPAAPQADVVPPTRLPLAAWCLAWSCLAGQVLMFVNRGGSVRDDDWTVVVSMLAGALVVAWFSDGVLRARMGRLVVVGVIFLLVLLGNGLAVVDAGSSVSGWSVVHLAASAADVAVFAWFVSTPYFAWRREHPREAGPSLRPLIAIAVAVGILGGAMPSGEDLIHIEVLLP
jgi:hypothetical protein